MTWRLAGSVSLLYGFPNVMKSTVNFACKLLSWKYEKISGEDGELARAGTQRLETAQWKLVMKIEGVSWV